MHRIQDGRTFQAVPLGGGKADGDAASGFDLKGGSLGYMFVDTKRRQVLKEKVKISMIAGGIHYIEEWDGIEIKKEIELSLNQSMDVSSNSLMYTSTPKCKDRREDRGYVSSGDMSQVETCPPHSLSDSPKLMRKGVVDGNTVDQVLPEMNPNRSLDMDALHRKQDTAPLDVRSKAPLQRK